MENFNKSHGSIKNWAIDDRPREKMLAKGAEALSDSELLAIIINNGSKEKSAVALAREVLALGSNHLSELGRLTIADFQKVKGIGKAKAIALAAALELGRRRHSGPILQKLKITRSTDTSNYLQTVLKDYNYEVFGVIFLNSANTIKHFEIISKGGITGTVADPRVILKMALHEEATGLILTHNHPSGNLKPSRQDIALTQKIKEAAALIDIILLDHIIVSESGYYSFADEGIL